MLVEPGFGECERDSACEAAFAVTLEYQAAHNSRYPLPLAEPDQWPPFPVIGISRVPLYVVQRRSQ